MISGRGSWGSLVKEFYDCVEKEDKNTEKYKGILKDHVILRRVHHR